MIFPDRVKEYSSTVGAGDFTLSRTFPAYRSFDEALEIDDQFYYVIEQESQGLFEIGIGTYAGSGTFVRTTCLFSSSNNTLVNFPAGVKTVYVTTPGQAVSTSVNISGGQLDAGVKARGATTYVDLSDRFAEILSVKDFGAVGDGVTDDTAAFEAWWAALMAGSGSGFIPGGNYILSSQVLWNLEDKATTGVVVFGAGNANTKLDVSAVATSPNMRIYCAGGTVPSPVIQANCSFTGFGVIGDIAGVVFEVGQSDYSDYINNVTIEVTLQNETNHANARGAKLNACYWCDFKINAVLGGVIAAGSAAIEQRQVAFSNLRFGGGNSDYGLYVNDSFNYGNDYSSIDMEIVNYCLKNTSSAFIKNVFVGGQWAYNTHGVWSTAGADNIIIYPNLNPSTPGTPFLKAGACTGIAVLDHSYLQGIEVLSPVNAATINFAERYTYLAPAGALAALFLVLPGNIPDGTLMTWRTFYAVAGVSLTAGAGDSIFETITSMAANATYTFVYHLSSRTWYRMG